MKKQLIVMLELQNDMNSKVHPDWRAQNFEWYRAIWVECAELIDHYGWKWWKQQEPNIDQIMLELVDIWHFGLSILLLREGSVTSIAENLEKELSNPLPKGEFKIDLEDFAEFTLNTGSFDAQRFYKMMVDVDMSFNQLYIGYVSKNVLNFFRQDHGYQDGSYSKRWGTKEDNEHLMDIVGQLDPNSASFQNDLYSRMQNLYQQLVEQTTVVGS